MTQETLAALKGSIAHWERLSSGTRKPNEQVGIDSCDLCRMFWKPIRSVTCVGCPVMERTGQIHCDGSPYVAASDIVDSMAGDKAYDSEEFQEAAKYELEFLKSLLP